MPDLLPSAAPPARQAPLGSLTRAYSKVPGLYAAPAPAPVARASAASDAFSTPSSLPPRFTVRPLAAPAPRGLFARFEAWLAAHFTHRPTPVVIPPAPPAPPLAPGPIPPLAPESSSPAVQVFFNNTYGRTNDANQATAEADPNNPDKPLIKLIDSVPAGGVLDGAFFDIGVKGVVDAFVRAKQRGVNVRLVTEHDYYVDSKGAVRPPILALQAAGITVTPDDRPGLMHDKFLVAEGGPTGPTVWTGSYNITDGGTFHDNNNALELQSAPLAGIYEQEFKKMFEQHNFGTDDQGAQHPGSQTVTVGGMQVTPYFSPSTGAESGAKGAIMDELRNAKQSIQFLAFSFADQDMGQAMLDKARAGVKVEGVFETSQAKSRYSTYNLLAPAQAALHGTLDVTMDGNPALMHHKVILVDDSTIIMGSFNFSKNAQSTNDENMLVIKNAPELVAKYRAEFQRVQAVAKAAPAAPAAPGASDNQG